MRVDVHAHAFPATYVAALEAGGSAEAGAVGRLGAGDAAEELEARLRQMDAAGVDVQVLSTSALVPDRGAPDDAKRAAAAGNDALSEIASRWPDRFRFFGVLPMTGPAAAVGAVEETLARSGCVGINVPTSLDGRSIGDAAFEELFAELDRRSAVLFIHPAGNAAESSLVRSLGFDWLVGATFEATIAATHLIARGVPSRFPRLRIVNAQLGGALPMVLRRLDNLFPRVAPDAPEPPSTAARRMWFDTVTHGHGAALVAAAASFGPDRLVLGTDYPYAREDRYRDAVAYVEAAGLPDDEAAAILDRNGANLIARPEDGA